MKPNPMLLKMGFTGNDRAIMIHADDIGVTLSSLDAFHDLIDFGIVKSGSVMVPSPYFSKAVQSQMQNPSWDMGIHLTLNCESEASRWRPVSDVGRDSGLADEDGYFKQNPLEVMQHAAPQAVAREIRAQIRSAQDLGMKLSHADTHSLILMSPRFASDYIRLWDEFNILPVIFENAPQMQTFAQYYGVVREIDRARSQGIHVIDNLISLRLDAMYDLDQRFLEIEQVLDMIQPGTLTHFAIHPLKDSAEARAVHRNWGGRVADYEVFMQARTKDLMRDKGIRLIGYRDLTSVASDM